MSWENPQLRGPTLGGAVHVVSHVVKIAAIFRNSYDHFIDEIIE